MEAGKYVEASDDQPGWGRPRRSTPPLAASATLRWSVVEPILSKLRPARVLEIGCGQGGFGARIASCAEYVGVEMDHQSYLVARSRIEPLGGKVVHGDARVLGATEPFDLVCAFEVLEHIEDDVAAVSEWRQVLTPAGSILLSVPAWPGRFGAGDTLVGHYRRYTPDQLDLTLSRAGLRDVEHAMYGWPLGFVTEPVRNVIARRVLERHPGSMEERTAGSGRYFQSDGMLARGVMTAVAPFALLQRLRPASGIGIVGLGHS
jgi:SAM-dependent methyltransferase